MGFFIDGDAIEAVARERSDDRHTIPACVTCGVRNVGDRTLRYLDTA